MEFISFGRFIAALLFVVGLIGLCAWVANRFGMTARAKPAKNKNQRLAITEVLTVDAKRRLVLIRRDNREHLVLLGATGETLIESDIEISGATGTRIGQRDRGSDPART